MFLPYFEPEDFLSSMPFFARKNAEIESIENHWDEGLESIFLNDTNPIRVPFNCQIFFVPAQHGVNVRIPGTSNLVTLDNDRHSVGAGTLVMTFLAPSISTLVRHVFPTTLFYENITQQSFRTFLNRISLEGDFLNPGSRDAPATKIMEENWRKVNGKSKTAPLPTRQVLIDTYLDVVAGLVKSNNTYTLNVSAGQEIGFPGRRPNSPNRFSFWVKGGQREDSFWQARPIIDTFNIMCKESVYTYHPLGLRVINMGKRSIFFHLKFEVMHKDRPGTFEVIRNAKVKIMDIGLFDLPFEVTSLTTDNNGRVTYTLIDIEAHKQRGKSKFFFIIERPTSGEYLNTGIVLPAQWSTKAAVGDAFWRSVEGVPGYFKDGTCSNVGSPSKPVTFRVGLAFYFQLLYDTLNERAGAPNLMKHRLTPGLKAYLCAYENISDPNAPTQDKTFGSGSNPTLFYETYNYHRLYEGKITSDDINNNYNFFGVCTGKDPYTKLPQPGWTYFVEIERSLEDANAKMGKTDVEIFDRHLTWLSSFNGSDSLAFPNLEKNTINSSHTIEDLNAAGFKGLNTTFELNTLIDTLRFGNKRSAPLKITIGKPGNDGAWYNDRVLNMGGNSRFDGWTRSVIAHEFGHHLHWETLNKQINDAAWNEAIARPGGAQHYSNEISNYFFAFTEGWAEFFESLFQGSLIQPHLDHDGLVVKSLKRVYMIWDEVIETRNLTLGPTGGISTFFDLNKGLVVEGVFANCLTNIFWELIGRNTPGKNVMAFASGKRSLTETNPWLDDFRTKDVFTRLFWNNLAALDDDQNLKLATYEFAEYMLTHADDNERHIILGEFMRWNIMIPSAFITNRKPELTEIVSYDKATRILTLKGNHLPIERPTTSLNIDYVSYRIKINGHSCRVTEVISYRRLKLRLHSAISEGEICSLNPTLRVRDYDINILNPNNITFTA